jgi:hypothetical protein
MWKVFCTFSKLISSSGIVGNRSPAHEDDAIDVAHLLKLLF